MTNLNRSTKYLAQIPVGSTAITVNLPNVPQSKKKCFKNCGGRGLGKGLTGFGKTNILKHTKQTFV